MTRGGMSALQGKVLDLLAVADLDVGGGILDRMGTSAPYSSSPPSWRILCL